MDILLLTGAMGSGKSSFARSLSKGFVQPTFLINPSQEELLAALESDCDFIAADEVIPENLESYEELLKDESFNKFLLILTQSAPPEWMRKHGTIFIQDTTTLLTAAEAAEVAEKHESIQKVIRKINAAAMRGCYCARFFLIPPQAVTLLRKKGYKVTERKRPLLTLVEW